MLKLMNFPFSKSSNLLCTATITAVTLAVPPPAQSKNLFDFIFHRQAVETETSDNVSEKKNRNVSAEIIIDAPAKIVFATVHLERDCAPNLVSNNLLQSDGNHSIFKQEWQLLPLLAKSVCVMDEHDTPNDRIDFKLLKSDVFKRMDGDWELKPLNDGKSTRLKLNVCFQLRGYGPKVLVLGFARKKLHQRLEHIKNLAEQQRTELDVNASVIN